MERNNVYLCGRFRDGGGSAARSAGARGRDRGERRCKKSEVFLRKEIKGLSLQSFSATAQAGERASSLKDWKTRKVQASTDFNTIKI